MKTIKLAILLCGFSLLAFAGAAANAPEVDVSTAAGGFILVGGAILLIRSRLKR